MKKIILFILLIIFSIFAYLSFDLYKNNVRFDNFVYKEDINELVYYKLYAMTSRYMEYFENKLEIKKTKNLTLKKIKSITGIECKTLDYDKCLDNYYNLDNYMKAEKDIILELRNDLSQEKNYMVYSVIYNLEDIKRIKFDKSNKEINETYGYLKNELENNLADFRKIK